MYYSSDKFLHDAMTLKDTVVLITDLVEYELSMLNTRQYQYVKNTLNKNNVKVKVIKQDNDKKLKMR